MGVGISSKLTPQNITKYAKPNNVQLAGNLSKAQVFEVFDAKGAGIEAAPGEQVRAILSNNQVTVVKGGDAELGDALNKLGNISIDAVQQDK